MHSVDLISLILSGLVGFGTIALAVVAWKSIQHSNLQSRRQKEEHLVNIVIEWAVDCAQYAIELNKGDVVENQKPKSGYLAFADHAKIYNSEQVSERNVGNLQRLRAKSSYIEYLMPIQANELINSVDELTKNIKKKLEFIHEGKWSVDPLLPAKDAYHLNMEIYKASVKVAQSGAKYLRAS